MGIRSVRCPDCGRTYHVEERWVPKLGAKVRCESCDCLLWIPPVSEESPDMALDLDLRRPPGPPRLPLEGPALIDDRQKPLEALDQKLRHWMNGREDAIRSALDGGRFFAKFGHEFMSMVEGDPDLSRIEASLPAAPDVETAGPAGGNGRGPDSTWLALDRLRHLTGAEAAASSTEARGGEGKRPHPPGGPQG